MSPFPTIKKLDSIDSDQLSLLHNKCFEKGWAPQNFEDYMKSPLHHFWGAFNRNTLIGFILFQVIDNEAEILTFAVDPEFQNRGIGRQLLKTAVGEFKNNNLEFVFLDVARNNRPANSLYLSLGFQTQRVRSQYYTLENGSFEDAFQMKLKIK